MGKYTPIYNSSIGINLPCGNIFQSQGLYKHIEKRHPDCLKYLNNIAEIVSAPDYIGTNPLEKDSIEFVKIYDKNILVAVKLDVRDNYLYVASLFDMKESKLLRRINSGRFVKITY